MVSKYFDYLQIIYPFDKQVFNYEFKTILILIFANIVLDRHRLNFVLIGVTYFEASKNRNVYT